METERKLERYKRQSSIVSIDDFSGKKVIVIGAGGIGSWATFLLAKMGAENIIVIDDDVIEEHNVGSQLYDDKMIGMKKVNALSQMIKRNLSVEVTPLSNFVTENDELTMSKLVDEDTIVVLGVDSIEARQMIGKLLCGKSILGIVDGRMGGEQVEVYTYKSADDYYKSIENFGAASPDICTERAIVYNTNMCGALICSQVKKLMKGQDFKKNIIFDFASSSLLTN